MSTITAALRQVLDTPTATPDQTPEPPKESAATLLVRLAQDAGAELFRDDDTPYLTVPVGDHQETHRLRSKTGRAWLAGLFFDALKRAPGSQALADAVNTLEALCLRGPDQKVAVRIAAVDDRIFIDLGDCTWKVVEITATSWRLTDTAPVRFRRPKGLLALPVPQPGGDLAVLRTYINVTTEQDFILLIATLVAYLRGRGPYPVVALNGEQGSAKSTTARIIKALLDPSSAPLRSSPKEPRDLMIAASHSHVIAFDNLSDLPGWLSDALCRLSTGGGFSTRSLYSDDDEVLFDAVRPIVLNGITEFASRPDLVSRTVFVSLPAIPETQRRDESTFWAAFNEARPSLLGALLDVVVMALRNESSTTLDRLPRMADFAKWIVAAEPACPWASGAFLQAYAGNRADAVEATLDGDPLADWLRKVGTWQGTARELLTTLTEKTPDAITKGKDWHKSPRQVGDAIRRLAPALRQIGIDISWGRQGGTGRKLITVHTDQRAATSSQSSPSSLPPEHLRSGRDESARTSSQASSPSSQSSSREPARSGPCDRCDDCDDLSLPLSNAVVRTTAHPQEDDDALIC